MKDGSLRMKLNSFGFRISLYYLLAGLAVIALFSGVVYTVVSDIFVKEAVSKTQMAIETSADSIGEYVRHSKNLLQIYAKDPALLDYASGADSNRQAILDKISAIKVSDSHIFEVFVLPENGIPLASRENSNTPLLQDIDTDNPCLSSERAGEYAHADPWTVTIAVPMIAENGEKLGVLAMDLDYCLFMHTVSDVDMGKGGSIFIVDADADGTPVFHTDKSKLTDGDFFYQTRAGYNAKENLLTHTATISGTNWTMVGAASLDGLSVLKRQFFDMVVFTGILLMFALLVITVTVSKKLTTPISRLVSRMEDIESLAELAVKEREISEASILTESYNRMIQRIKELMQELAAKQSEIRQFELDALTSQINPHFLYNTLDTIVWLAEFKESDKIISITKSLAAFFRLSLNNGKAVISLQDEIEHVKKYLFIQKERYGDKLTYSFEVEDAVLECMVPKIILQPIVENALYHGIKPMDGIGHIQIKTEINGADLIIRISDNGVGYDPKASNENSDKKRGGVGLCNVQRRINLYYEQEADLQIKSSIGEGTTVTLTLKTGITQI